MQFSLQDKTEQILQWTMCVYWSLIVYFLIRMCLHRLIETLSISSACVGVTACDADTCGRVVWDNNRHHGTNRYIGDHAMCHHCTGHHAMCHHCTGHHAMCHHCTGHHAMYHHCTGHHAMCHHCTGHHVMCHHCTGHHDMCHHCTGHHAMCHHCNGHHVMCHHCTGHHAMCHHCTGLLQMYAGCLKYPGNFIFAKLIVGIFCSSVLLVGPKFGTINVLWLWGIFFSFMYLGKHPSVLALGLNCEIGSLFQTPEDQF